MSLLFVKPSLKYIDSYLEELIELEKENFPDFIHSSDIKKNKEKFIEDMELCEGTRCSEIKPYFIPSTLYWLVNEKTNEYLGRVSIRHSLGNELLQKFGGHIGYAVAIKHRKKGYATKLLNFGLEIAKEKELAEILITCREDNFISKKIIENANGIFINSLFSEQSNINMLRYRIILNLSSHEMWQNYLKKASPAINEFDYNCFCFSSDSDYLGNLVLQNEKKATTSLKYWYEEENEEPPKINSYSVILNSNDFALCLVKTNKITELKFKEVDSALAYIEGEGDKSLEYWQKEHINFFTHELSEIGKKFDEEMTVLFIEFNLV